MTKGGLAESGAKMQDFYGVFWDLFGKLRFLLVFSMVFLMDLYGFKWIYMARKKGCSQPLVRYEVHGFYLAHIGLKLLF